MPGDPSEAAQAPELASQGHALPLWNGASSGKRRTQHLYGSVSAVGPCQFISEFRYPLRSGSPRGQNLTLACGVHPARLDTLESHDDCRICHQPVLVSPLSPLVVHANLLAGRCPRMKVGVIPASNKPSHRACMSIIGLSWFRKAGVSMGRSSIDLHWPLYGDSSNYGICTE